MCRNRRKKHEAFIKQFWDHSGKPDPTTVLSSEHTLRILHATWVHSLKVTNVAVCLHLEASSRAVSLFFSSTSTASTRFFSILYLVYPGRHPGLQSKQLYLRRQPQRNQPASVGTRRVSPHSAPPSFYRESWYSSTTAV